MKTKAAVVYQTGKPIEVEELELDGPRDGEVLIRYTHAGLCHSDVHIAHGDLEARLPMVLGHEGAGTVRAASSRSAIWAPPSSRDTFLASASH
jgi:Zn-dependent alcohol dehydrogenase